VEFQTTIRGKTMEKRGTISNLFIKNKQRDFSIWKEISKGVATNQLL
jgi:hypothetical protein